MNGYYCKSLYKEQAQDIPTACGMGFQRENNLSIKNDSFIIIGTERASRRREIQTCNRLGGLKDYTASGHMTTH